jgi:hypothetical protein
MTYRGRQMTDTDIPELTDEDFPRIIRENLRNVESAA